MQKNPILDTTEPYSAAKRKHKFDAVSLQVWAGFD